MVKSYTITPRNRIVIKKLFASASHDIKILIYKYLHITQGTFTGFLTFCFSAFSLHFFQI